MIQTIKVMNSYSSTCLSGQALELINKRWIHSIALAILVLCSAFIHATVLSVALDGSQDFTVIQTAINASAHGDTVLVYPGRYYENVRFNGKNIKLASLELLTGNRDYIYSTIIDGNQSGSVITAGDSESNISIRGFTITKGSGEYYADYEMSVGGGIRISMMTGQKSAAITNCLITGNSATTGGGIRSTSCYLNLSGVTIRDNYASIGGGIFYEGLPSTNHNTIYNANNRCSIFSNYAATGSDLYYYNVNSVHIIVDTLTVTNPWNFYASAVPSNPNITNPFTFDILNTVHQEVNHDLFVATWGDDSNSGLSPTEPMRSIFMAMYRIASDSENPKTVHVADGVYSPTLNGQHFPIAVKSHTRLKGSSSDRTILDSESDYNGILIPARTSEWIVSNLTIMNAKNGISSIFSGSYAVNDVAILNIEHPATAIGIDGYRNNGNVIISDVRIDNVRSPAKAIAYYEQRISGSLQLYNVEIANCESFTWMPGMHISTVNECDIIIDGCNIHDNRGYSTDVHNNIFQITPYEDYGTRLRIDIRNSAFYDNYQTRYAQMGRASSLNDTLYISNSTFAGNSGGNVTLSMQGTSVMTNNIFHNPAMSTQISISGSASTSSTTTMNYNNILGGINGVYNATSANPLIWGEGNTDHDPMFSMQGNRPYTLSYLSPLIDSGWQPALAEPGFDAGGNERLWDGDGDGIAVIDKGAYEYQPIWSPINLSAELWNSQVLLSWEMPDLPRGLSGYRIYRNHQPHADIDGADHTWFRERVTVADTLIYQVAALYGNVESALSDSVVVIVSNVQSSDELAPMPPTLNVGPNPFTDLAVIRYTLPQAAKVELSIYNLRGQKVRRLESEHRSAGEHFLAWEGCDDRAQALASGVYLLRMSIQGQGQMQRKMVLVK